MYADDYPDQPDEIDPTAYGSGDGQNEPFNSSPTTDDTTSYGSQSILGLVQSLDTPSNNDDATNSPSPYGYDDRTWRLSTSGATPSGLLPAIGLSVASDDTGSGINNPIIRVSSAQQSDAPFSNGEPEGSNEPEVNRIEITGGHYTFDPSRNSFAYNDGFGIPLQLIHNENGDKIHAYADGNETIHTDGSTTFEPADNSSLSLDRQGYDQLQQRVEHLEAKHSPIWDFFTGSGNVITPAESSELDRLKEISRNHDDGAGNTAIVGKYLDIDNTHFAKIQDAVAKGDYVTASDLVHYYEAMPQSLVAPAMHDNPRAPWPDYFTQVEQHQSTAYDMLRQLERTTSRGEMALANLAAVSPELAGAVLGTKQSFSNNAAPSNNIAITIDPETVKPSSQGQSTVTSNAVPSKPKINETTRFVNGVVIVEKQTGKTYNGTVDLQPTLNRIQNKVSHPHRNDGSVFQNRPPKGGNGKPLLPIQPAGHYTEYVMPTPGVTGPGPQRIITGQNGEVYYTPDHYDSFIKIK